MGGGGYKKFKNFPNESAKSPHGEGDFQIFSPAAGILLQKYCIN